MIGIIYLRTNKINGKRYVGQTNNIQKRQNEWNSLKHRYAGGYINAARNKYGVDNFDFEILQTLNADSLEELTQKLDYWETYYISHFDCKSPKGYNLTDGGGGSRGYQISEETRKKLSEIHRGENNNMYGKHHSKKTKELISLKRKGIYKGENNYWYGKHLSEETKQKISQTKKENYVKEQHPFFGKHHSEETKHKLTEVKGKKVYQYDLNYKLVRIWLSTKECGRNGFNQGCVWKAIKHQYGKDKTNVYKGYIWSYVPPEKSEI